MNQIEVMRQLLENSVNYQLTSYSIGSLQAIIKSNRFNFDECYNNEKNARRVILDGLMLIKMAKNLQIDKSFVSPYIEFVESSTHQVIIYEIPNSHIECESNYIALAKSIEDNSLTYFTSEYMSSDNKFQLFYSCGDMRFFTSTISNTLKDFKNGLFACLN